MPFVKGHSKIPGSGRVKGMSSKATVSAILSQLKCDPIEGMARIAMDSNQSAQLRGRMFAELAQYVYPKRRAIELGGIGGEAIEVNVSYREQLLGRVAQIAARK
jgi:hypothetical protein